VHSVQPPRFLWCWGVIAIVDAPRSLLHLLPVRWEIAATIKLQKLQSRKTGITGQKELEDISGVSKEDFLLEIHDTRLIIRFCVSQLRLVASEVNISQNNGDFTADR
jgi:hypothetical protein